jgi:hypothetical protein
MRKAKVPTGFYWYGGRWQGQLHWMLDSPADDVVAMNPAEQPPQASLLSCGTRTQQIGPHSLGVMLDITYVTSSSGPDSKPDTPYQLKQCPEACLSSHRN